MTVVTLMIGNEVAARFTRGSRAVMACTTAAKYLIMINKGYGAPSNCRMACFTDFRGIDMHRGFAGYRCVVVTTDAVAHDPGVINYRRRPRGRSMTIVTGLRAWDVNSMFADDRRIVMT